MACDCGRGAVFFAAARGKIAEVINFEEHQSRCVIMVGYPIQPKDDPLTKERMEYLER